MELKEGIREGLGWTTGNDFQKLIVGTTSNISDVESKGV